MWANLAKSGSSIVIKLVPQMGLAWPPASRRAWWCCFEKSYFDSHLSVVISIYNLYLERQTVPYFNFV